MAKSNLLKTQDVTFLELIGNGKKYRVPSFQRDYAWEEEQWEDLWHDILELVKEPGSFHYMVLWWSRLRLTANFKSSMANSALPH